MRKIIFLLCCFFFSLSAFAEGETITCEEPTGARVDYFKQNKANLENERFMPGRDRVTGLKPQLKINNETHEVSFIIGNTAELKTQPIKGNMRVLAFNESQVSFTGVVNGAPILGTFYPELDILIYSQQSTWPGGDFVGARAMLFYSKCIKAQAKS